MTTIDKTTVTWQRNGSATVLARVCARDATGQPTGVSGEGNWIRQADLATIVCAVFDRQSATPEVAISNPTVTISTAIYDVPVTDGKIWDLDNTGWNFLFDLPGTCFPISGRKYLCQFSFFTTGGSTFALQFEGIADPVY